MRALRAARALPTQKGPVLPRSLWAPPNALIIAGNAEGQERVSLFSESQRKGGGIRTPGTDERADLASGSGETVELAPHGGRAGFSSKETKAVTRPQLAKAEEYAVDDGECTDVGCELLVETAHDETDDSLEHKTGDLKKRV